MQQHSSAPLDAQDTVRAIGRDAFVEPPEGLAEHLQLPILWVPSEHVYLAVASLPLKHASHRLKSLPFALEPQLGEPIHALHFAIGPALKGPDYLALAVSGQIAAAWVSMAAAKGASNSMLVPDVMMLPCPDDGSWNLGVVGDRVLVRQANGRGFATHHSVFNHFHSAAASPPCRLIFGPGGDLPVATNRENIDWPTPASLLDIRQGVFARNHSSSAKRLALGLKLAGGLFVALSAIAVFDLAALDRIENDRSADLQTAFETRFPGTEAGSNAQNSIREVLAESNSRNTDQFLSLMSQTGASLSKSNDVSVQKMTYDSRNASLSLEVEGASLEALQSLAVKLNEQSLPAKLGAATAIDGGAQGLLTISGDGRVE